MGRGARAHTRLLLLTILSNGTVRSSAIFVVEKPRFLTYSLRVESYFAGPASHRQAKRAEAGRLIAFGMKYWLYVLRSRNFLKSYVGFTDNLERRIKEHNSGRHVYTKRYLPWEVVHTETFLHREEARQREKYLKSAAGRRFLKKHIF